MERAARLSSASNHVVVVVVGAGLRSQLLFSVSSQISTGSQLNSLGASSNGLHSKSGLCSHVLLSMLLCCCEAHLRSTEVRTSIASASLCAYTRRQADSRSAEATGTIVSSSYRRCLPAHVVKRICDLLRPVHNCIVIAIRLCTSSGAFAIF